MAPGSDAGLMASSPTGQVHSMLRGLALLGRGKRDGLLHFDASVQGFLASLAPWIAFILVDGFVAVLSHRPQEGATEIAVLLCFVLMPPVVSQALSLAWDRDARWLRYATASTWCEWLMPLVFGCGWLVANVLVTAGLPQKAAFVMFVCGVAGYWIWLHFFLGRAALDLSRMRACLLVAALVTGNGGAVALAYAIGGHARAMFGA